MMKWSLGRTNAKNNCPNKRIIYREQKDTSGDDLTGNEIKAEVGAIVVFFVHHTVQLPGE